MAIAATIAPTDPKISATICKNAPRKFKSRWLSRCNNAALMPLTVNPNTATPNIGKLRTSVGGAYQWCKASTAISPAMTNRLNPLTKAAQISRFPGANVGRRTFQVAHNAKANAKPSIAM